MTTNAAPDAVAAGGIRQQAPLGMHGTSVVLQNLSRSFGATRALDGLSIDVAPGELVALLGPSGCGKTTALRIVAGFEFADAGSVLVDGKDVSSVPANRRDMGMVFQSYSLFPNMNALDNVAFGLRMRKKSSAERRKRAAELLDMVGLTPQAKQYPHQLSGGQQQRVALARALAIEPRSCCLTSHCPPWTLRCACSCGSRSARCSSGSAPRPYSSPTTRRKPCRWPTGSAS